VVTTSFVTAVVAPGGKIDKDLVGQRVSVTYFAESMKGNMTDAAAVVHMSVATSSNEKLNNTPHGRVHVHYESLDRSKLTLLGDSFVNHGDTPAIISFNITFVGPSVRINHIELCELLQVAPKKSVGPKELYKKRTPEEEKEEEEEEEKAEAKRVALVKVKEAKATGPQQPKPRPPSGYYGVYAVGTRWKAQIRYDGKQYNLGRSSRSKRSVPPSLKGRDLSMLRTRRAPGGCGSHS
jgi:hypothetical protein